MWMWVDWVTVGCHLSGHWSLADWPTDWPVTVGSSVHFQSVGDAEQVGRERNECKESLQYGVHVARVAEVTETAACYTQQKRSTTMSEIDTGSDSTGTVCNLLLTETNILQLADF